MRSAALSDMRFWLIAAALAAALAALAVPRVTRERGVYDVLAVIDITSSMTTRDVAVGSKPASRLEAAKDAVGTLLARLPCESRLGLALFTERQAFLLFEPVEVCGNFAAIESSIDELTWRMGWEGGSYVAKGLYSAVALAKSLGSDLVFLSDGHEAPPLPFSGLPPFEGKRGEVGGLIVGVGGHGRTPLIKYDDEGREVGSYGQQDLPQENRSGPPPPDAEKRPGYHPKWAPFGNAVVNNDEHVAFVREPHLKELASVTGLSYTALQPDQNLLPFLAAAVKPRPVKVASDVRAYPGALALALLVILYGLLPLLEASAASRPSSVHP